MISRLQDRDILVKGFGEAKLVSSWKLGNSAREKWSKDHIVPKVHLHDLPRSQQQCALLIC